MALLSGELAFGRQPDEQQPEGQLAPLDHTLPESGEYYGSGPGFDMADLLDAPWQQAKKGFLGALEVLDTPGRGVRTFLGTGDLGQSFEALYNPEKAVSATDLRRKYLFDDVGEEDQDFMRGSWNPANWDWGDAADFGADLAVGMATDPLSYATFGASGAAKQTAQSAQKAVMALGRDVSHAGKAARAAAEEAGVTGSRLLEIERQARAAAQQGIRDNFLKETGKHLPDVLEPGFNGLEKGFFRQLNAGEKGLQLAVPFADTLEGGIKKLTGLDIPLQTSVRPLESGIARAAAVAANPFEPVIGGILDIAGAGAKWAGNTSLGRKFVDGMQTLKTMVLNPSIRDAFGLHARDVENVVSAKVNDVLRRHINPAMEDLQKAKISTDKWYLAEDMLQTWDPLNPVPHLKRGEGAEHLLEQHKAVVREMQTLDMSQRAAVYSAASRFHAANMEILATIKEVVPNAKMLDESILTAPNRLESMLDVLNKAAAAKSAAAAGGGGPAAGGAAGPVPTTPKDGGPAPKAAKAEPIEARNWDEHHTIHLGRFGVEDQAKAAAVVADLKAKKYTNSAIKDLIEQHKGDIAVLKEVPVNPKYKGQKASTSLKFPGFYDEAGNARGGFIRSDSTEALAKADDELVGKLKWTRHEDEQGRVWFLPPGKDLGAIGRDPELSMLHLKARQDEIERAAREGIEEEADAARAADDAEDAFDDADMPPDDYVPEPAVPKPEVDAPGQGFMDFEKAEKTAAKAAKKAEAAEKKAAQKAAAKASMAEANKDLSIDQIRANNLGWKKSEAKAMDEDTASLIAEKDVRHRAFKAWKETAKLAREDMPLFAQVSAFVRDRAAKEAAEAAEAAAKAEGKAAAKKAAGEWWDESAWTKPPEAKADPAQIKRLEKLAEKGEYSQAASDAYGVVMMLENASSAADVLEALKLLPNTTRQNRTVRYVAKAFGNADDSVEKLAKKFGVEWESEGLGKAVSKDTTKVGESLGIRIGEDGEEIRGIIRDRSKVSTVGKTDGGDFKRGPRRRDYYDDDKASLEPRDPNKSHVIPLDREGRRKVSTIPRAKLAGVELHTARVGDELGVDVHFVSKDQMAGHKGLFRRELDGRRVILIRAGQTPAQVAETFGHELTHAAVAGLDGYQGVLLNSAKKILGDKFGKIAAPIRLTYKLNGLDLTDADLLHEILANAGGELFADNGLRWISEAAKQSPGVIEAVVRAIQKVKETIMTFLTNAPQKEVAELKALADRLHKFQWGLVSKNADVSDQVLKEIGEQDPLEWLLGRKASGTSRKSWQSRDMASLDPAGKPISADDIRDLIRGGRFSKKSLAAMSLEEIQKKRDEVQAALKQARRLANAVPNYAPGVLASGVLDEFGIEPSLGGGARIKPAGQGQVSFRHGETMGDKSIPGVSMTIREREAHALKGGIGTRATAGELAKDAEDSMAVVKRFFKGEKVKSAVDEEVKAAHLRAGLFERNPVAAYQKYLTQNYAKALRTNELAMRLADTFNAIPVTAWEKSISMAHEMVEKDGKLVNRYSYEAIAKEFKLKTGTDLSALLPEDTVAHLKSGKLQPQDVLKGKAAPGDGSWQQVDGFMPTKTGPQDVFLPRAVAERYAMYRMASSQRLGDTITRMLGPYTQYLSLWKQAQVIFPGSQIRNMIGDLFRMVQTNSIDGGTMGDMKTLWSVVGKHGFDGVNAGNWEAYQGLVINVGARQMPAPEFLELAEKHGVINSGRVAEILAEAAEQNGKRLKLQPEALKKYKQMLVFRENTLRLSTFASRMRQGEDVMEAALKTEETLYNQLRISPAADFLRKTGIAPFISWTAKNIPAQIEYALTNPGKFAAMLRGVQMLEQNEVPEEIVPKHLKDKYNIVMSKGTDDQGRAVWQYITVSGVIPITDLTELAKDPGVLLEQLGPAFNVLFDAKSAHDDRRDDGSGMDKFLRNTVGKPYQVASQLASAGQINPRTGEQSDSLPWVGLKQFSPTTVRSLNVQESASKALARAKSEYGTARGRAKQLAELRNQAAVIYSGNPQAFQQIDQQFAKAMHDLRRAQGTYEKTQQEVSRTLERVRGVKGTP